MEFKITEKNIWHDRIVMQGKELLENKAQKQITGEQKKRFLDFKACTFKPATLSRSQKPVSFL